MIIVKLAYFIFFRISSCTSRDESFKNMSFLLIPTQMSMPDFHVFDAIIL